MSVDIASLVIEIDSTQAVKATADLDKLTAAGERAQGSAGRVRTATEQAGIGIQHAADASATAAKSATDLANSQGAVEKATRQAAAAWMSAKTATAAAAATQQDMVRSMGATTAELNVYQSKMLAATMAQLNMTEAQARAALGFKAAATAEKEAGAVSAAASAVQVAGHGKVVASSLQVRESLVLMREASQGNFTRMAGSASILAGTFGLMTGEALLLLAAIVALAAPFVILAAAMFKGEAEIAKFNGALIATGHFSGLTADNLETLSKSIAASSDTTIGSAKKTVEALTASGKYSADAIASLSAAAQDYSRITGENADKFIQEYEGMKDHLVKFAVKHEDVYHDLTLQQIDHIALLVREGRETQAQDELAADIASKAKQRVDEQAQHWGTLQNILHGTAKLASEAWGALLGIGRPETIDEQIEKAQAVVDSERGVKYAPGTANGLRVQADATLLATLKAVKQMREEGVAAQAKAAQAQHDAIQAKYGDGKPKATKADPVAERLQALAAEAAGNRLLAASTDLTTVAGVKALAMQKALADAAKTSRAGTDQQTLANKFYAAELAVVVTAAAKKAEEDAAATDAQSKATEQATGLVQQLGVSQGVANKMVADANELAKLHADYDAAALKDKPLLAKAIADTAAAQERKNLADQAAYLAQTHLAATDQLDQLRLEASLIGASNEQRAVAIAQLKAEQDLRSRGIHATLMDGSANPDYAKAVEDAKNVARAQVALTDAQELYNLSLHRTAEALGEIAAQNSALGSSLGNTFGQAGTQIGQLITTISGFRATMAQLDAEEAQKTAAAGKDSALAAQIAIQYADKRKTAEVSANLAALDSFKQLFNTRSAAYKVLQGLEIAYQAVQLAGHIKELAMGAVATAASIANSIRVGIAAAAAGAAKMFESLGPLGFAAVAAMVAVLASMGLNAHGGGGGPSITNAQDQQKKQGTGTILGDIDAKSASLQHALDIVAKNTNKDFEYFDPMLRALRSIDSSMGALTAALARALQLNPTTAGGLTPGVASSGFGVANGLVGLAGGAAGFFAGGILSGTLGALAANTALAVGASTALAGSIGTAILGAAGPIGAAIGALAALTLKTKVETDLKDSGVLFGNQTLADVLQNGVAAQSYQDFTVTSKTNFLGIGAVSKSTKNVEQTSALDASAQQQISLVITAIANSVVAAAQVLGVQGADATIKNFQIEIGKLSLQGLKGQDLTDAISAVFSKLGDQMADFVVPAIEQFQQAGEGLLETLVRVAKDYQVVDVALQSIGKTFGAVGIASIAAREDLISLFGSLDEFQSETQFFADNFLTDAQRIAPIQKAIQAAFAQLGVTGVNTKAQFAQLVESLDLTTDAGRQMYASLLAIAPAFSKVMDYLTGGSEDVKNATDDLTKAYQDQADQIQSTIDKFQGFADSLKSFRDSLDTGPNALLTPEQQYNAARAAFQDTAAKAQLGDPDALGNLQNVSQAFLDASKTEFASSGRYFQDLATVKAAVTAGQATAARTVDNATAQLSELKASVSGLIKIDESVMSVHDAIVALQAALTAAGGTTTPFSPLTNAAGSTTPSFTYTPPVVDTGATSPTPTGATGTTTPVTMPTQDQIDAAIQANLMAGRGGGGLSGLGPVQLFATGGSFTVGGTGGTDSQHFGAFMATPGEIVNVRRPGDVSNDNAELIAEVKALRGEVVALRQQVAKGDQANVQATDRAAERHEKALDRQGRTQRLVAGGSAR